jgi:hypothetical protein
MRKSLKKRGGAGKSRRFGRSKSVRKSLQPSRRTQKSVAQYKKLGWRIVNNKYASSKKIKPGNVSYAMIGVPGSFVHAANNTMGVSQQRVRHPRKAKERVELERSLRQQHVEEQAALRNQQEREADALERAFAGTNFFNPKKKLKNNEKNMRN